MNVEVITPDKNVFSGTASMVKLPGSDGEMGILDNHAPLIATLGKGTIGLDGDSKTFDIEGGVVEVLNNNVMILAE